MQELCFGQVVKNGEKRLERLLKFLLIAGFLNPPKSPFSKGGLLKEFR